MHLVDDPALALIGEVRLLARRAGEAVMAIYATDFDSQSKPDASPVTEADRVSEALILARLRALTPDIPVVAEEAVAGGDVPDVGRRFWLVDPLDGTKEFILRNGEFTVNIALVADGFPVLGVVVAPAVGKEFWGVANHGAYQSDAAGERQVACRLPPQEGLTVVASRSHGDPEALERFLAGRQVAETRTAGSSLKLCLVASGEADVYPRLGRTMEWDIAAGHAVLSAAGGHAVDLAGAELRYGKPGFENPAFVAWGHLP